MLAALRALLRCCCEYAVLGLLTADDRALFFAAFEQVLATRTNAAGPTCARAHPTYVA